MSRIYKITWDGEERAPVERHLSGHPLDAREAAVGMASRNPAWRNTQWAAQNGDVFGVDHHGNIVELTQYDDEDDYLLAEMD